MAGPVAPPVQGWGGGSFALEARVGGETWQLGTDRLGVETVLGSIQDGWVGITCDVVDATWASGASRDDGVLTRAEAGSLAATLANPDGRYDPQNPDGPWFGRWDIATPLRIWVGAPGATPAPIPPALSWSGVVDALTFDGYQAGSAPVAHLAGIDGLAQLNAVRQVPVAAPVGLGDLPAARIGRVLDRCGWTGGRNLAAGGPPLAATSFTDPPGVELLNVCEAARWQLWIGPDGSVNAGPYLIDTIPLPPVEKVWQCGGAVALDVAFALDTIQLRNMVDVAAVAAPAPYRSTDPGSIDRYGVHAATFTLPWRDQPDAVGWADWLISRTSTPALRVDRLDAAPLADPSGATWDAVAGVAPRDVWRVIVDPFDVTVWIRGYQHTVSMADWHTAVVCSVLVIPDVGPWWTLTHPIYGQLGNRLAPSTRRAQRQGG